MQSVIETDSYLRDAKDAGMAEDERNAAVDLVSTDPEAGDVMPGTGGVRKARLAGRGKGKSGGYRIVWYFGGGDIPVFLLTVFDKGEKANLTQGERNALRSLTDWVLERKFER
ncbi:MAG: type II toxin-antitoxin system RelE/ParE family toxin [Novosphingobium sp.]|nr:type II toxin-antitoxin system RelE/ParE family toxin [Novosphingobium sp.]